MGSVELLTAQGQLSLASEFRFDIHQTESPRVHEYITVKRGRGAFVDKWAIAAMESSDSRFFDRETECWSFRLRGNDAYVWDLEPALLKAQELRESARQERGRHV